ncbi:MAG: hypothetical protein Q7U40_08530 [Desulfatirhabdiaceae bacterium]|nr:hypothetical protein [Desulfatirhabdiaceae bacterium]
MYRDPWHTGAWTRTDTQPWQPGNRPPDAAWIWDRRPGHRHRQPGRSTPNDDRPKTLFD